MKVTFRIHYNTTWGKRIAITGNHKELGNSQISDAIFMDYAEDGRWTKTIEIKDLESPLTYRYVLLNDEKEVLDKDWGEERSVDLTKEKAKSITLYDSWRSDKSPENSLYTSAFTNAIFKQEKKTASKLKKTAKQGKIVFRIYAPRIKSNEQIVIVGNIPALGLWNMGKPLFLENSEYPIWSTGELSVDNQQTIEYKYGIYDNDAKRLISLEAVDNRSIRSLVLPAKDEKIIQTDNIYRNPAGYWKGSGVAVPVFSLRSEKSCGVGEFTDLHGLIDWADKIGLKMVQILPVNDTNATGRWTDSYPYGAISVFALHPQYLSLEAIEGFKKAINQANYKKVQKSLNALPEEDYEAVMQFKLEQARLIYAEQKDTMLKSAEFKTFLAENEHWLPAYAAFCYLRDKNKTADFNQWSSHNKFTSASLKKLTNPKAKEFDELAFWYFIQYHLDRQLAAAGDYARGKGIILKGDIPIGIYRYSADAWTQPELYNMDGQSGAPPDPFSEIGQNWGFPTYNWAEMAKDGFQWWKNRFTQLSRYFDAFRIDHILGFFRIWQIPLEQVEGSFGFFNPAIPIARKEFKERGIVFDFERYCQAYITEEILVEFFGKEADTVEEIFLDKDKKGRLKFKNKFSNQRKVEAFIQSNQEYKEFEKGLYTLHSNVLFFAVEGSRKSKFHPRIDLNQTSSFKELPADIRSRIEALYNDYFYHRQEEFWKDSAMSKLPAIKEATNMLICGEDLGMVPACVPGVMDDLSILTLEIQRMSKNPETEFLQEQDIPYLSVASPSTHDMSPIRLWWEEMKIDERNRFYNRELHNYRTAAPDECTPDIAKQILQQHLSWKSMWVVFPLQDILAISPSLRRENPEEERINVPANPQHYWRFRFHISNEELLAAEEFNEDLGRMVMVSGR
jgi:4-alpha-glucanotransferase